MSTKKRQVKQQVYRDSIHYYSSSAADFIKLITDCISSMPAEYRDSARVDFEKEDEYGDTYCYLEISYDRPETDQEEAARIQQESAHYAANEARERQQFLALQAKFGAKP